MDFVPRYNILLEELSKIPQPKALEGKPEIPKAIQTLTHFATDQNRNEQRGFIEVLKSQGWESITFEVKNKGGTKIKTITILSHPKCQTDQIQKLELVEDGTDISEGYTKLGIWITQHEDRVWKFESLVG